MKPQFLYGLLWSGIGIPVGFHSAQPLTAQASGSRCHLLPLCVVVKPQQKQVPKGEPFNLMLHVVNLSKTPQSFIVTSCSWEEEWRASDPRLRADSWPCKANFPMPIRLVPGAEYQKTLKMYPDGGGVGQVSFRMGFTPIAGDLKSKMGTYWSNTVTLQVIPWPRRLK